MKHVKSLTLSFTLIATLAVVALGGETNLPRCAPGQTDTPPCSSAAVSTNSTEPGETNGLLGSDTIDVVNIVEAVQLALSLF